MLETIFTCAVLWIDVSVYVYEGVLELVMESHEAAIMNNWNKEADIICKDSAEHSPTGISVTEVGITWLQDALHFQNFS